MNNSQLLLWAPTMVLVSSLTKALFQQTEEVVKRDLGDGTWDKLLEMQEKTGLRRPRRRGKVFYVSRLE